MDIKLYQYNDEFNRIHKTLDESISLQITPTAFNGDFDILHPIIKLVSDTDLRVYNYAIIDNKHYFITKITLTRNRFFTIMCERDVLVDYAEVILKQKGTVTQSETSLYLQGTSIPVSSHLKMKKYDFATPFNENGSFVLLGLGYVAS